jgi:hypothetical protein
MKVCPRCKKTYSDDNLNFCLDDGTVLAQAGNAAPETVMMNQPRMTNPQPTIASQNISQPTAWGAPPQYATPKKSSKAWLWVVGILGLIVVLCGGGFGILALIGMSIDTSTANSSAKPSPSNSRQIATTSPSPGNDDKATVESVDLSQWVKEFSVYGTTEFTNGEFMMASKQKGFYYVLVAPDEYSTSGSNTRVTLRNVENAASTLGYGLIFHSNPTPLTQDYAFLIDTVKKRYRVVRHQPQKETAMVSWTNTPIIKEGSQENTLEAKDKGESTDLYINGQMVTSVKNNNGYKNGVPGLYSGDAVKIAFKNLEIRK